MSLISFIPSDRRAHFTFRNICFAGRGNSCSSVTGRAFPHPDPGGCRPHTPAVCGIRANIMTYPFQPRPPAVRAHFTFRNACFAGCGNSCLSVTGRTFPHPDLGGCRPHIPASCEIRANIMTYPFQPRPPFECWFGYDSGRQDRSDSGAGIPPYRFFVYTQIIDIRYFGLQLF